MDQSSDGVPGGAPPGGFVRQPPRVAWMHSTGISKGWDDGTYRPGASVSRDVMAAFLHRFAHTS